MSSQVSVHTIVAEALLEDGVSPSEIVLSADRVATSLVTVLRRHGLAIHVADRCARLPQQELGRPMTQDEMVAVGLELVDWALSAPSLAPESER